MFLLHFVLRSSRYRSEPSKCKIVQGILLDRGYHSKTFRQHTIDIGPNVGITRQVKRLLNAGFTECASIFDFNNNKSTTDRQYKLCSMRHRDGAHKIFFAFTQVVLLAITFEKVTRLNFGISYVTH